MPKSPQKKKPQTSPAKKSPQKKKEPAIAPTPYPNWTPPAPVDPSTTYVPFKLSISGEPEEQKLEETNIPLKTIPLIDRTRKNYIPRIDYKVLLQKEKEIFHWLN
ncbi:hypothetical protein NEFER03_2105 [Nematocida sp. LUAm3]|nr:hypothetical protein NEFER03_2105 [Nematocida sp. LUAm3]KAI5175643.1 hypothetical protein NEFER02_1530 [Nematocida sp. LUAm2]KAI5178549.1 hypothetical protein NEFER01_1685 [Nematocida sp. LUAm1]